METFFLIWLKVLVLIFLTIAVVGAGFLGYALIETWWTDGQAAYERGYEAAKRLALFRAKGITVPSSHNAQLEELKKWAES